MEVYILYFSKNNISGLKIYIKKHYTKTAYNITVVQLYLLSQVKIIFYFLKIDF